MSTHDQYYNNPLWNMGLQTIKSLETERGILASSKNEIYGCIFGRDSLISALKLMSAYELTQDPYLLATTRKILINLMALQGKTVNIESGEEPGKCIHEFRPDNHTHLTQDLDKPWYVYPDNIMRNYDSVDSTPLLLIAINRYYTLSGDEAFMEIALPNVYDGIDWIILYGDTNFDGFIDYRLHPDRSHGGLTTQSWMDSVESVFHEDGTKPVYPIAPVEVQAYAYTALKLWSIYFENSYEERARLLNTKAENLKAAFNKSYIINNENGFQLAAAIDGAGKQITSVRSSMGHVLWAGLRNPKSGKAISILEDRYVPALVDRLLQDDIFVPEAGIRTLSTKSRDYQPNSYHNGSIWPHDTAIVAEGMLMFGYVEEAVKVRQAQMNAIKHFDTPIELFTYDKGEFGEWESEHGQKACKQQAWSAASLLA